MARNGQRKDKRYKDPDSAPPIVSEKRMTFFLSHHAHNEIRLQGGKFQVANIEADDSDEQLPEARPPSRAKAIAREAVQFWLDQFAPKRQQARSDDEWEERLERMKKAVGK